MKKKTVIAYFGNAPALVKQLHYAHRNVCYGWPDELTDRIYQDIIRRMMCYGVDIPPKWKKI